MKRRFTWDPKKAAANLKKHGVSFSEAESVVDDPRAIVEADEIDPERIKVLGMSRKPRLLLMVFVEVDEHIGRIVTARRATPHERRRYEEKDED